MPCSSEVAAERYSPVQVQVSPKGKVPGQGGDLVAALSPQRENLAGQTAGHLKTGGEEIIAPQAVENLKNERGRRAGLIA